MMLQFPPATAGFSTLLYKVGYQRQGAEAAGFIFLTFFDLAGF